VLSGVILLELLEEITLELDHWYVSTVDELGIGDPTFVLF
jgi:hypothetical protein